MPGVTDCTALQTFHNSSRSLSLCPQVTACSDPTRAAMSTVVPPHVKPIPEESWSGDEVVVIEGLPTF